MSTFTASNGIEIDINPTGAVALATSEAFPTALTIAGTNALRELFQHERDEELGRWRWPVNPAFVVRNVTPTSGIRVAQVLDERDMSVRAFTKESISSYSDFPDHQKAAKAYLDAHPEPKPWHGAKDGEVWVLTVKDVDEAWAVKMGTFRDTDGLNVVMPLDNSLITAGRRIWPEEEAA